MSEPRQLVTSTAGEGGESLAVSITESERDDYNYTQQAWELSQLLLSIGRPTPVVDLASHCTHSQASSELIEFLCSIPNSPISLAGNGFHVTLSRGFLSACATYACSLGLMPDAVIPPIRNFLGWSFTMPMPYFRRRVREIDEEEELQLTPLPKKIRRDPEEVHSSVMAINCKIINEQADNLFTMVNGSMIETLKALESRALMLRYNQDNLHLVHDATFANTIGQSSDASEIVVREPWVGPRTQLSYHNIFDASSGNFKHMHFIEERKPEVSSLPEVGVAEPSWIVKPEAVAISSVDASRVEEGWQSAGSPVEAADLKQIDVANVNPLDIGGCKMLESGDIDNLLKVTVGEIAENQGIMEGNGEDKNKMNLCPNGETQTSYLQSNVGVPSVPSESELRSTNIVPDSDDMPSSSHKQPEREDDEVVVLTAPVSEQPLNPSATTGNEIRLLDHKTQVPDKPLENKKAYNDSPQKQHSKRNKGSQKKKQNQNGIRLKDRKDLLEQKSIPDFESYVIEEEEGSGGYGTVYRAKRKSDGTKVAVKCPHADAQKQYVNNEQRMLERFGGKNFIIKYEGCLKNGDCDCFILEHVEHDRSDLLKKEIDVYELQWYGYCMFRALASLHKQGVVHRDVKPGNFLFSRRTNKGYLIDFNLAMDLHEKYLRTDKSKSVSNLSPSHVTSQSPKSELPTTSKKHHTLVNSQNTGKFVTTKTSQTTLAPNSLKKTAGKMRAQNDLSRWDRFNSQGADGSGVTSAKEVTNTRNNPSGEKKREPLPCHGRKELINFLQETMSASNHEVSRAPASIRKRVAALPGKAQKDLLYLTPMPLRSNGLSVAGTGVTSKGGIVQKKDGPCAGTKGFRAPEVCLRSLHQGPKIDMWSAGVTLLYLMIGRTPFSGDPEQNMKDIAKLRGSEDLWEVSKLHNRESSFPQELYEPQYLKRMELREWCRLNTKRRDFLDAIPRSLYDLVDKCLTVNPRLRISAEDALRHDFFSPLQDSLRKQRLLRHHKQTQPAAAAPSGRR